jgi:hypothetical protein
MTRPPREIPASVTAVIVNFNTHDMTRRAALSLRSQYPALPLLVIDNGSDNGDAEALRLLEPEATLVFNGRNLHHGPAMDQALRRLDSPYALLLDSDCEVIEGGFIEAMAELLERRVENYAAGHRIYMNRRGFDIPGPVGAFEYIRPYCMMIKRELYLGLPPFRRHGAPCLANMRAAVGRGYTLIDFPVGSYVRHEGRGTAGKFGYHLGLRGRINHILNKVGL